MAERGTKQRQTAVCGDESANEAGMKRTSVREGNAEIGLKELGKAMGKMGRHFVQKWGETESVFRVVIENKKGM